MMATSHTFPSEESLPHPPPNFQTQQINTKQAVIYNKSGTKCMNIVKDPSGMPLSPTSPSTKDQNDISPPHNPQNNNGTTKKKKKKKSKRKPPVDHVEESDIQVNGSHNNHVKTHQVNYNSENEEETLDVDIEEDDEFFSDDDGYDPEAPEIPFPRKDSIVNHDGDNHVPTTPSKKKKKKKKNKNGLSVNQIPDIHHNHSHHNHNHKSRKDGIWNTNNSEERQRIREFWLQLGEEERRSLVKVEKEAVLKKMKEQQKHSCSCSVCGKKRTAIEAELETLYDAYYEELESYANQQQFVSPNIEYRNDVEYDEDEDDDEYEDDDDDDDDDYEGSEHDSDTRKEFFNFGNSLTVKGGILTVADDLLKNDGKKFLEMMERLAERRMQREEEAAAMERDYYEEEEDDDDDEYEDDGEEDNQTEEQRMEEGRRMFQIFAAKMFEQRVLNAYREKVAQERQQKLLEELEEENRLKEEREQKKLKEKEKKKAKNRALKQQKEEERARKEAERLAEEKAQKAERERKLEEERKRREEERLKKEAERRAREEERQRREEEKRRKAKEEKEREERRKKEQEAKERKEREKEERERKEREEKARKEKEERRQREERERKQRELKEKERKEREEQERKDREKKEREAKERERKEKEEQERKDREEKERKEREEKQRPNIPPLRQQHHERKRTVPPIGQPSAQPPPPISTPVVQNKPVVSMPNGMNWMNYSSHEQHQPLPQHSINPHVINSHLPPPPNHPPPHPLFNPGGPQTQFGGQPVGIMNGPAGMTNEAVNEVFTNNKKVINPPPQGTNTLQGISPTSSLFATGLGPIGMGVHPHHGGPPVPMHAHQVIRQMPPPRSFNPIAPTPHLPGPSGVPPSVASTNLSLLNEAGVAGNPQTNAFGGIPICGGQGPLGPQTFNLGSQVVNQPASSHMGPSVVVPNTPLAPIGHRRMSQHPEDSHIKVVQRPQPIQRPRRNSTTGQSLEARTRSPPPGFGNMVGSGALLGDDQTPMVNRRQSLASGESSYFSNSLFSTAMPGEQNPPQSSQNQQQQQHGTNRLSHRPVGSDTEWPPIRGRQGVTDNLLGESVSIGGNNNGGNNMGTTDIWGSNYVGQSLWYPEGNNNSTNRRVMGSRDFGIP